MTFYYVIDPEELQDHPGILFENCFFADGTIQVLDDRDFPEDAEWVLYKALDEPTMGVSEGRQATKRIETQVMDPETGEPLFSQFGPVVDVTYELEWEDEAQTIPKWIEDGMPYEELPYTVKKAYDITKKRFYKRNKFFSRHFDPVGDDLPDPVEDDIP